MVSKANKPLLSDTNGAQNSPEKLMLQAPAISHFALTLHY